MNSNDLDSILAKLHVKAEVFHSGQYCGGWAIDTSGSENMTFHIVTEGECFLEIGEFGTSLAKGDAVFFPKDGAHILKASASDTTAVNTTESIALSESAEFGSVGLVCGFFKPLTPIFGALSEHFPEVIVLRHDQSKDSAVLINLMISEAKTSDINNSALLDRYADCLFYLLLRDHLPEETGLFAALSHPKLKNVINLIHSSEGDAISVEHLAEVAGMSRSRFASLFKTVVGQSPKEYTRQWRMTRAYQWLSEEGVTTLEAAMRCGYENEASFAKAFKRVIGIGPGAIRTKG